MPETTDAADKRHRLEAALQRFKNAAVALSSAWELVDDDNLIADYPDYLPNFDAFLSDVLEMSVRPVHADPLENALREIMAADPVDLALDPNWPQRVAREALKRSSTI